jgi:hypothetical protein
MRRTYISPEYKYQSVYGTFNMEEESSFFGSKMLEIEDSILLTGDNLVYYQDNSKQQLDLGKEYDYPPVIYNLSDDKKANHTLALNQFQTPIDKLNYAKWIMTIKFRTLFKNYLFATLKKYRTFEGVTNEMTFNKSVDSAIKDYIDRNILNRYRFSEIMVYITPIDLLSVGAYKYRNVWDTTINKEQFKFTKFSTQTDFDKDDLKLYFSQDFLASRYAFKYYFELKFDKL